MSKTNNDKQTTTAMSGGHFDYNQYRVRQIAEDIERLIAINGQLDKDGWGHDYPPGIIERFKEAAHTLERAADMAQRVDWLVSGDDGPDSFMERWDAEVRDPWTSSESIHPEMTPNADKP